MLDLCTGNKLYIHWQIIFSFSIEFEKNWEPTGHQECGKFYQNMSIHNMGVATSVVPVHLIKVMLALLLLSTLTLSILHNPHWSLYLILKVSLHSEVLLYHKC